ncbi:MAG: acyl-CoA thioesterase [Christensenellales bacterium]
MQGVTGKRVAASKTEQVQIVMPEDSNSSGRLFGGKLMQWIDIVAGIAARRHANCNVTTLFVDSLHFKAPANMNDTIVLIANLVYVGRTSMEVKVDTYAESLLGERKLVNSAYLVLVALDSSGKPTPVPPLILETDDERREWEEGLKRREIRKQRNPEA